MPYDPQRHRRRSIRLQGYDYSQAGAHFVTLCAWQGQCLFGQVITGCMRLNDIGVIVAEEWARTGDIRPNVTLGEFVVMPNHLHGIIILHERVGATGLSAQWGAK